jgi:hypothetical protein
MKFRSSLHVAGHSLGGVVCAGAVMLIASSTQAQNLFEVDAASGNIYEFTPGGAQSTFVSWPNGFGQMAFSSAGDLFVTSFFGNSITQITPGGVQSTFASGLNGPDGIAFQGESLPVPEPSVLGLLAVGATTLLVRRRRNLAG